MLYVKQSGGNNPLPDNPSEPDFPTTENNMTLIISGCWYFPDIHLYYNYYSYDEKWKFWSRLPEIILCTSNIRLNIQISR